MSNVARQQPEGRRHTKDSEKNRRVPSLRFHKASGQMYVVLSGKAIYCGKPEDPATKQRYHQAVAEWLAAGQQPIADPTTITIKELLARFWTQAEQYYRTLTDGRAKELEQFRLSGVVPDVVPVTGTAAAIDLGRHARHQAEIDGMCVGLYVRVRPWRSDAPMRSRPPDNPTAGVGERPRDFPEGVAIGAGCGGGSACLCYGQRETKAVHHQS